MFVKKLITMKRNYYKIVLLFFLFFGLSGLQAQSLYVRPVTGVQSAYALANLRKLTFSGGNLILTPTTGSNGTFALSGLRYLNFVDLTLDTPTNTVAKSAFYVYPNPVSAILYLSNLDATQVIDEIAIISMEGRLLFKQNPLSTQTPQVNVAALPSGMYFCQIQSNNKTQTVKFLKQ
jgi:hypothetical protein